MTDPYKELREALAPVEKKRWMRAINGGISVTVREEGNGQSGRAVCTTFAQGQPKSKTAWERRRKRNNEASDFIAAANPAIIAALLAERDALKLQLEWTERYALDTIKTDSKDMDDWRGDMQHIANSARAALSQSE